MNGTQTFILECSRINSVGVIGGGEDFNNKSSWTNQTAPILLKQGDQVQLQNVLINVGGADTNAIQFQGVGITPQNSIQDNFTLMKCGFYLNHNGIYTTALPLKYDSRGTPSNQQSILKQNDNTTTETSDLNYRTNNDLGTFYNYQYWGGKHTTSQILPLDDRIARFDQISSLNPFNPMNGGKFAIIHPYYAGWARPNDDNGNLLNQVSNVRLLEQDIPILLPKGFISPTGIADLMTNTMSYTNPNVRNPQNMFTATANKYKQDEDAQDDKVELKQYSLNGYTYQTINCNLQGANHRIYGCLGVGDPNLWLYGTEILSNSSTDNMTSHKRYFNQDNHPDEARVDYPVIIWQRFIGNDPTDFELGIEGRNGQYSNYSPFRSDLNTSGDNSIIEVYGMSSTFSDFNDVYRNQATTANDGFYLAQESTSSYRLVKNSVIGTNLNKTAIFVDNDATDNTKLIAWRRFPSLSGNWTADEHQIFKTTDVGQPNVGNSNPYQFSGAGAGEPSDVWFTYSNNSNRTIFMGINDGGLGFTGYVYISNVLTEDSGGIIEGGEYKISFTLTLQDGYSWSNTAIGVGGNGVGLSFQTFTSDGDHEVSFTATGSSVASNAIAFGVYYSNIGAIVEVSNISILRENLTEDDSYSVNNVWNNNTSDPENNKIFSITKNTGLSNLELELTDNISHTYFNRTYKVIARGVIANFINGNFVCSTNLTSHDPNVAMLYNDDETDYTFWIFQTSNPDLWVLYRLEKYQGGIPENNTILGAIDGAGIQIKNPNRAGQQYYDFSVSNPWENTSPYIDFPAGNGGGSIGWNTSANGTGNNYVANEYIYQGLTKDRTLFNFSNGNNYTGGSGGSTYSFAESSGETTNGFPYDNILTITTGSNTELVYLQTTFLDGTRGEYEYNNVSAGTGWVWNGSSINFIGAFSQNLTPSSSLTTRTSSFAYDYHFDGYHDVYLNTTITGTDAYLEGTYLLTLNAEQYTDPDLNGTWEYNSGTGEIKFYRNNGNLYFTLFYQSATNPATSTITYNRNFTSFIQDPLPTIQAGAPINETISYFATYTRHVSYGPNPITFYFAMNPNQTDTDLEGQRGRLIWEDGGTWNDTTWDWNGTDHIDMNVDTGFGAIYYQGSAPSLTNVFEYETSQNFVVNSNTYAVPVNGKQYGLGFQIYGNTNTTQASSGTQYLGFNTASEPDNVEEITEGYVYDNLNDSFANNNGKKWKLRTFGEVIKITILDATDEIELITLENPSGGNGYLTSGWTLLQVDKKLDSEISGSGSNGITFTNASPVGYITLLKEAIDNGQYSVLTNGSQGQQYQIFTNNNFASIADTGTFKNWDGSIDTDKANLQKNQLLMTNIKFNQNNLSKIQDLFRNTETYNGDKFTRNDIKNDTRNYFTQMDLGRSNESYTDFENKNASQNQTGRKPWVANYMRDQGIMGVDNGDNDTKNMGCVCPVFHSSGMNENRIQIFTGWLDNYEQRIKAEGLYGDKTGNNTNYCYGNSLTTAEFKKQYPDYYNQCKNENIGVIPFINKETGDLMIGFELYKDYDGDIYKIQNLTWFGYSPSVIDHKYITFFNPDAPSIKDDDYNYTSDVRDQMNFIQVGATQPTVEYNTDVNKFTLRYFHTPTFFNKQTGSDTNIGQEIAKFFDNADNVIFRDYCYQQSPEELADDNRRNIGINDSQSGIYIKDIYYQKRQINNNQITSSGDSLAVKMTPDNFYNSFWFKLGFSYYDLKPIKFKFDAFYSNRFNNITYNNTSSQFRETGLVPFTTNSLININDAPIVNIFSQNSGTVGTENTNKGTPIYGLGFNNNLPTSFQVESDSLFPASIPVNIGSGYYRIYTDLPIDTLTYTAGGSNLAVIGSALLNYASSQQFFFSYGMDYGATITKDVLINNIKIEIRSDRGELVEGLGDRSMVVIKIVRNITLSEPPPDPQIKELKDIEEDIEELVSEVKEGNLNNELEQAQDEINRAGIGIGIGEGVETKTSDDINTASAEWWGTLQPRQRIRIVREDIGREPTVRQIEDFGEDLEQLPVRRRVQRIEEIARENNLEVPDFTVGDDLEPLTARRRTERIGDNISRVDTDEEIQNFVDNFNIQMIQNLINRTLIRVSDDEKNIARRIASGLANYFLRRDNIKQFNKIVNDLYSKGIEDTLKQPYLKKFVESMNKFYINIDGKPLKGARRQPEIAEVTDKGALVLYDKIAQLVTTNRKIKVGQLTAGIIDTVGNMILNTNDIKIYDEDDPDIVEAKLADDTGVRLEDLDTVKTKETRGIDPEVRRIMKRNFIDYGSLENYLTLYGKFDEPSLGDVVERDGDSDDLRTLRALYKDAGKFTLQDNPVALSKTITRMNNILEDVLGTRVYDEYAIDLEQYQTVQSLTGTGAKKPKSDFRRTKKQIKEAREMEEEDPRILAREERRRELAEEKERRGERRETRLMREEDKPKTKDFRRKEQRRLMREEGIEESPLRTKGRSILAERAKEEKEEKRREFRQRRRETRRMKMEDKKDKKQPPSTETKINNDDVIRRKQRREQRRMGREDRR